MAWSDKVAGYSKAIQAVIGVTLMYGTLALDHQDHLPGQAVYYIGGAVAFLTAFNVWLVRNEKSVKDIVDATEDLYERVHPAPQPDQAAYAPQQQYQYPAQAYPQSPAIDDYYGYGDDETGRHAQR